MYWKLLVVCWKVWCALPSKKMLRLYSGLKKCMDNYLLVVVIGSVQLIPHEL